MAGPEILGSDCRVSPDERLVSESWGLVWGHSASAWIGRGIGVDREERGDRSVPPPYGIIRWRGGFRGGRRRGGWGRWRGWCGARLGRRRVGGRCGCCKEMVDGGSWIVDGRKCFGRIQDEVGRCRTRQFGIEILLRFFSGGWTFLIFIFVSFERGRLRQEGSYGDCSRTLGCERQMGRVSAFVWRAVAVPEGGSGLADDPADERSAIAFLGAFPLDEDGAALGGKGDAGLPETCEELLRLPLELRAEFFRIQGRGLDVQAGKVIPEALGDGDALAGPGEVEAGEQRGARMERIRHLPALVEIVEVMSVPVLHLGDVLLRHPDEFDLQHDPASRILGPVLEPVGIHGFPPFRRGIVIGGAGRGNRRGGESGEGEERAAVHGGIRS